MYLAPGPIKYEQAALICMLLPTPFGPEKPDYFGASISIMFHKFMFLWIRINYIIYHTLIIFYPFIINPLFFCDYLALGLSVIRLSSEFKASCLPGTLSNFWVTRGTLSLLRYVTYMYARPRRTVPWGSSLKRLSPDHLWGRASQRNANPMSALPDLTHSTLKQQLSLNVTGPHWQL